MKLLFISSLNLTGNKDATSGVGKKILLEIKTFRELGFEVDYVFRDSNKYYIQFGNMQVFELAISTERWYKDFNTICHSLRQLKKLPIYDYLYLRLESASFELYRFLKFLRKYNTGIKLISEIPTVSKKWENGTPFVGKIKFIAKEIKKHLFCRNFDLISTFDLRKKMYGVRTVCIENFADVSALPVRVPKSEPDEFNILAIALMTEAHGFDRIIKGLALYYNTNPTQKVTLTIIGEGPAKKRLEQLTSKFRLNNYVYFAGLKNTEQITEFIDKADIGAGSLAIFRKNCKKASELKIREYCARALPFFYSAEEPILKGCPWCLKVPHDESSIDIITLIKFIESLDKDEVLIEMRKFAEKKCICRPQMQRVIDELN